MGYKFNIIMRSLQANLYRLNAEDFILRKVLKNMYMGNILT